MRRAEILEVRAIAKHVADRDQDGVRDGHSGALGATSARQAVVARREEAGLGATGPGRTEGGFDRGGAEPGVATAVAPFLLRPPLWLLPGQTRAEDTK